MWQPGRTAPLLLSIHGKVVIFSSSGQMCHYCRFAAVGEGWVNNVDSSLTFLCCQSLVSRDHGSGDYHWTGGEHDADLVDLCSGWMETREQYSGALVSPVNGAMQTTTDPGPGNVTTWTVRPSTQQERQCYRDQESKRYAAAEEAWQWQCHDYTALVAPVRTMTQASVRPHPMLLQDRPVPVSLLTLVRDAVSRLPNGRNDPLLHMYSILTIQPMPR